MKLLALGPLPPPLGGTTVLFEDFVRTIDGRVDKLTVIDTNDRRSDARLSSFVKSFLAFVRNVSGHDVITVHASVKRFVWYGAFLRLVAGFVRKPVILRAFGGALDLQFLRANRISKLAFRLAFSNSLVLLETKHLVEFFKGVFPQSNVEWLPNSRSNVSCESSAGRRNGKFIFVGNVSESKGVGLIVEVLKSAPAGSLSVDIAGPLSSDFSQELLVGVPGLRYLGVVPSESVGRLISQYEALVLPTSYEGEGYPGVIIEAYSQGTPVIATSWRSIPEIVVDGVTGFLIPPKDTRALGDAMTRMLSDKCLLDKMRLSSLSYAKNFSSSFWHGVRWDDWLISVVEGK